MRIVSVITLCLLLSGCEWFFPIKEINHFIFGQRPSYQDEYVPENVTEEELEGYLEETE